MLVKLQKDVAALKHEVEKLRRTKVSGRGRLESFNGMSFGGDPQGPTPILVAPKSVVIVSQASEGDEMIAVREVRYRDNLPAPCTTGGDPPKTECSYVWEGETFWAYPAFGMKAIGYRGDELTNRAGQPVQASDTNLPLYDTVFHRCWWKRDYWELEPRVAASGGAVPGKLLTLPGVSDTTVHVQPYKLDSDGAWVVDDDPIDAIIWPGQTGLSFRTQVNDYLPIYKIGTEYVTMQSLVWYAKTPLASIPKGDCGL